MKKEPPPVNDSVLKLKSRVPAELRPDLCGEECGTRAVTALHSECLMNRPVCRYAMLFGAIYLCRHCRHQEMRNRNADRAGGDKADPARVGSGGRT